MPQLKRYIQQLSPSGNVGAVRADPGLADTGADLLGKGAAAMGGAIAGLSSVFQQVQDIQDETDLSTADRQAGEYMAKVWSDIEREPDYKQHETLYANALSKLTEFAPASPRANRMYQQRINAYSPSWKSKLMATSIRRMNWTIERDNKANIESSYRLMKQALERGDSETAEMAQFNIYVGVDILKKYGLISPDEAAKMKEDSDYAYDKSNLWYGAMEVMKLGQLDKAEEMIMASNLLEEDKSRAVNLLRYHNDVRQAKEKQEAALLEEQERTGIFEAIQDQRWDELPNLVRSSKYLSGTEKYQWLQRFEDRAKVVVKAQKDPFEQTDLELFGQLWRAVNVGDESVTEERLASFVGKGLDGGISVADFKELVNLKKQRTAEGPTVKSQLIDSYLDQITAMESDIGGEAGFLSEQIYTGTNWKEYTQFGKAAPKVLGGDMKRSFQRWCTSNPKATPDEMDAAFQSLVRAVQKRTISAFLDGVRMKELSESQATAAQTKAASLPLTVETAPIPKTQAEFEDTVRRISDVNEARKYYEKYKSWQQKKQ